MNKRLILFQIGSILILEAGLMLPSLGVALLHSEQSTTAFFFSILITAGAGLLLNCSRRRIVALAVGKAWSSPDWL
ncbi:MAG: hypothetical protein ACLSA6_07685 [Holdemania massiliensis]